MKPTPPRPTKPAVAGMYPPVSSAELCGLLHGLNEGVLTEREVIAVTRVADWIVAHPTAQVAKRDRDWLIAMARANKLMPKAAPKAKRNALGNVTLKEPGDIYSVKPHPVAEAVAGLEVSADGKRIVRKSPMPVPPHRARKTA